ncbi:MAG: hypothetical protein KF745_09460 [Phycisphaeraceae bacterium]|nr:hypothetical protein [Phycisphaeraceae bacterium]
MSGDAPAPARGSDGVDERLARRTRLLELLRDHDVQCEGCGYLLRGLQGVQCPECGWVFDSGALARQAETLGIKRLPSWIRWPTIVPASLLTWSMLIGLVLTFVAKRPTLLDGFFVSLAFGEALAACVLSLRWFRASAGPVREWRTHIIRIAIVYGLMILAVVTATRS